MNADRIRTPNWSLTSSLINLLMVEWHDLCGGQVFDWKARGSSPLPRGPGQAQQGSGRRTHRTTQVVRELGQDQQCNTAVLADSLIATLYTVQPSAGVYILHRKMNATSSFQACTRALKKIKNVFPFNFSTLLKAMLEPPPSKRHRRNTA